MHLDFDRFSLRHHRHRRRRGVDTARGLGCRDPLHPVDT